jgi:hypothetical protein
MRFGVVLLLSFVVSSAWADKAGLYAGLGVLRGGYADSIVRIDDAFEDETSNGWRAEVGYIWDIGKPGGFHMGVSGAYDDFGKLKGRTNPFFNIPAMDLEIEGRAFSVYFVGEQQLARWCHFVFKVGPTVVSTDLESSIVTSSRSSSDGQTDTGVGAVIAFTFFPMEQLAIELASQGHVYVYESDRTNTNSSYYYDNTDYDGAGFGNLALSLQYRF